VVFPAPSGGPETVGRGDGGRGIASDSVCASAQVWKVPRVSSETAVGEQVLLQRVYLPFSATRSTGVHVPIGVRVVNGVASSMTGPPACVLCRRGASYVRWLRRGETPATVWHCTLSPATMMRPAPKRPCAGCTRMATTWCASLSTAAGRGNNVGNPAGGSPPLPGQPGYFLWRARANGVFVQLSLDLTPAMGHERSGPVLRGL